MILHGLAKPTFYLVGVIPMQFQINTSNQRYSFKKVFLNKDLKLNIIQ